LQLCFVFAHANLRGRNFMPSDDGQTWKVKVQPHTCLSQMTLLKRKIKKREQQSQKSGLKSPLKFFMLLAISTQKI
jgi:hypothetical protein